MSDPVESELIFKIHRLKNELGEWNPAIEDVLSHEIDPSWVGGLMYLIFDRYLSNVEDSKQHQFSKEVFYWLNVMKKNGDNYIDRIKSPPSLDS
jgi:hypothetical protein